MMLHARFLCCLVLGCLLAAPVARAGDLVGKCVAVIDGVTLDMLYQGRAKRVRLDGVGCPEPGKPFGAEARQALAQCVADHVITVKEKGCDAAGNVLGVVYNLDNWNVNATLVHNGFAWVSGPAAGDALLATAEALARRRRKGLWKSLTPADLGLARNDREIVITSETLAALRAPAGDRVRVYITRLGRKYHTLNCKFSTAQKIPVLLSSLPEDYEPCPICNPPVLAVAWHDEASSRILDGFGISDEERQDRLRLLLANDNLQRQLPMWTVGTAPAAFLAPIVPVAPVVPALRGGGVKLSIIEEPPFAGVAPSGLSIDAGPQGGREPVSGNGNHVYKRKQ